jgi:glycosyltransferase involved in cell wall biosynthesis
MRVVMLGDYPRAPDQIAGGVEAVTLYLVESLKLLGDLEIDVVTLDREASERRTTADGSVTVHYLPSSRRPSRLSILENTRALRAEVERLRPDLVHAHIAGTYAEAAAATGLPWVLTLHGIRFLEAGIRPGLLNRVYRRWFIRREELCSVRRAPHVISISPFIESTFGRDLRGKVHSIENPVSEAFFDLAEGGEPGRILFVGRLIPRKGVDTLLHAFSDVLRRRPETTLRLAGGGITGSEPTSFYGRLERIVADRGLEGAVAFLGELDEESILEEYARCSALVLPSILETAPMVTLQAMAAGRAVVSTDAGGARYLVEHGKSGLIVPIGDARALGDALCEVLSDDSRRRAMGRRGKEIAEERFRAERVAARTREVYYEAAGARVPELARREA